jgi:hypothetical protein
MGNSVANSKIHIVGKPLKQLLLPIYNLATSITVGITCK